jgi:MFS transporter, NNP family, nitrate/nitrite transporter
MDIRSENAGLAPHSVVHGSKQEALWLATLGFFGGFAGVAIFGPLVPHFEDLMHLSPFWAGMLAATANLTGSLLRIPFGAWVDKVGGRRPFLTLLGLTLIGIGGLLVVLGTHYPDRMAGLYPVLVVLGMLAGCGIATFSVGIAQVSYWFPRKEQGGALGIFAGLGNTAPGLSSWLLPVAVGSLGILAAYGLWFAILAVITLVYAVVIHDAPSFQFRHQGREAEPAELAALGQELTPAPSLGASMEIAARKGATWALVSFYFTTFGGFLALTVWLPSYWHAMYDLSLIRAGLLTLIFAEVTSLVRVPGGLLADRLSIRYALSGNFSLIAAGALAVAFSGSFLVSFLGTLAIGLGMGLQNAIVFKLLPRYIPEAVGSAAGLVGGLGAFGGFFIPPVMGAIVEIVGAPLGYARGFLLFDFLVVVDLVGVFWLARWRSRVKLAPRQGGPSMAPAGALK